MESKKTMRPSLFALSPILLGGALLVLGSCEGTTSGTETGSQISLQGRVLDKDNAPVAGVTVRLAKTGLADTTDFQGQYHILKDTAIQAQPGVLDTLVFLQDSQRVAELEVTRWVETFPDVKLIQRSVTGRFTIADPGIDKVEAVLSGTGIPPGRPVVGEFFYNRPANEYSGFLYFPPGGSASFYTIYINVYDTNDVLIGRSDTISFNGLAGDITIPVFDPGNARQSGWTLQASGTSVLYSSVYFFDLNRGWISGGPPSLKTLDGGTVWAGHSIAMTDQIQFINGDTGWALEHNGYVRKTIDGGSSWVALIAITPYGFHFLNNDTGWVVGYNGQIQRTTDGGSTWVFQSSGTVERFYSVQFVDAQTGWAAGGYNLVARTVDGGANWTTQNIAAATLHCVHFANASLGLAVGNDGFMARTTDGGATWARINLIANHLYSVRFQNTDTAWVVGDSGTILTTTDGGITWARQNSGTIFSLRSVYFVNANTGWAVGERGTILKTTTGGRAPAPAPN